VLYYAPEPSGRKEGYLPKRAFGIIHLFLFNLDLMEKGTIKRLTDRGFGFIEADSEEYDDDLFFHANELEDVEFDVLTEGEEMKFEVTETPKGMNAVNVSRVEE
jgi:CspA family cold shock protein